MDRELIGVPRISPGKSDCRFLDGDPVKSLPIEFRRFLTPDATSFLCSVFIEPSSMHRWVSGYFQRSRALFAFARPWKSPTVSCFTGIYGKPLENLSPCGRPSVDRGSRIPTPMLAGITLEQDGDLKFDQSFATERFSTDVHLLLNDVVDFGRHRQAV